jgi:hypothetical protein
MRWEKYSKSIEQILSEEPDSTVCANRSQFILISASSKWIQVLDAWETGARHEENVK